MSVSPTEQEDREKGKKFKIVCLKCGDTDCKVEQQSPPHWDGGYRIKCNFCGSMTTPYEAEDEIL